MFISLKIKNKMCFESFFSTLTVVVVKWNITFFIDSYRDYGLKILQHKMLSFERAGHFWKL